jgi:alkanesulfonate monooxygenase SsuD/methylene tetrahydromethanopterin reductase-like flavin-dependent oxidoreductase (luciferase family)
MAKESRTLDDRATQFARIVVTTGGDPIVGTATDIADQLETLSEFGVDGILLSWFDFENGLKKFSETVLPILEQRGLRAPFHPSRPL